MAMVEYQEWLVKQAQSTKWYNKATKERFESQRAWRRDMSAQERGLKDIIEIAPETFRYSWPAPPMVISAAKKALEVLNKLGIPINLEDRETLKTIRWGTSLVADYRVQYYLTEATDSYTK